MKIYVLVANVENIGREDLEAIEAKLYASYDEFKKEVKPLEKGIDVYLLTDFMDLCNNEEFCVGESWIGYVYIQEKQTVWLLEEFDQHFSSASRVLMGVFSSQEKATTEMQKNYEDAEVYENGTNQWMSNIKNIGVNIREVELDKLEEL